MDTITLDGLHVVLLLGAAQGLILAGVLAVRRRNRTANRILALAMAAFTIYLASSVYHAVGWVGRFPHFFGIAYPMPLLFGPLVYLYAVTASDRARRLHPRDALHALPFLLFVLLGLPIYLESGPDKIAFYAAVLRGDTPLLIRVFDPLKMVSGVVYTAVTLRFLQRHRAMIRDNYSSLEQVNLQWLVRLAAGAAAIWLLALVFQVTQAFQRTAFRRGEDVVSLGIALMVYGIGYMALRQAEIRRFDTEEYPVAPASALAPAVEPEPVPEPAESRYERSGLGEREAAALKSALLGIMERDRPWLNSELTLSDLAGRLSTTPHKLSEVLNGQLQQTFYDFVNGYRVRAVQQRIASDEARSVTILSMALDAGFASKSTFNEVFKKHTGLTPSDYRKSVAV